MVFGLKERCNRKVKYKQLTFISLSDIINLGITIEKIFGGKKMKNMRKLLSLLLAVVMTMSLAIPALAADFTDVPADYKYYSAIQSLVARGIINGYGEDNTFRPEKTITRAEFCKMVVYAIGLSSSAGVQAETGFPDVAPGHWASGAIKIARDQQIINGLDDGTFRPEDPVTYEQAIKMTVIAKSPILKTQAEKAGGYPQGFVTVASNYGFLKRITDGVALEPAKRGTIAQLVDNMLKIDLSEQMGGLPNLGGNDTMEEVNGQVVAVQGASIEPTSTKLSAYQIKVILSNGDAQIFDASEIDQKDDLYSFLGKQVTIYYEDSSYSDELVISSMSGRKNRNDEQTLSVDEIIDYSNTHVEYDDNNDDEQKISISSNAIILYNGSYYDTTDFETLLASKINKAGSIRFLSTDGEGADADVVFFTSYDNWFVTSKSPTTMIVYGEVNGSASNIEINTDDKNKTITITKNGKNVDFGAIEKNQILSISKSNDGKFIEVLISSDAPSGKITGLTREEGTLVIGNKTYSFAPDVTFGTDLTVGATVKLYLDAFGKVAKYVFEAASNNYSYGYLMQIENFGTAWESDVQVQLLSLNSTSNTNVTELPLASTVIINGKSYSTDDDYGTIETLLETTAQYYEGEGNYDFADGQVFQPIRYAVSDGAIDSILIGKQNEPETDADMKVNDDYLTNGIKCTINNTTLANIYTLSNSTKVLFVPKTDADRINTKKYTIKSGNNSGFVKDSTYKVLLVDVSKAGVPAVVVVYEDSTSTSTEWTSNQPMVVTKKAEGEDVYEIYAEGADGKATFIDDTGFYYNQVEIGDIIRVNPGNNDRIDNMEVTMKAKDVYDGTKFIQVGNRTVEKDGKLKSGTYSWIREGTDSTGRVAMSLMAGVAYDIDADTLLMALDYPIAGTTWDKTKLEEDELMARVVDADAAKIIAIDKVNSGFRVDTTEAEFAQITSYEDRAEDAVKLFVYSAYGVPKLIVIFRAE